LISSITRDRIANNYAFVLKTSQLEELLNRAHIETDVTLVYWKPQIIGSIFEAHFWLPNDHISYNRLYVRAGALPQKDISLARAGLQKDILPVFEKWITSIVELPIASSTYKDRYFEGIFKDNQTFVTMD
jgi:hypothetical protein